VVAIQRVGNLGWSADAKPTADPWYGYGGGYGGYGGYGLGYGGYRGGYGGYGHGFGYYG